ncbi:MAG: hypothetical protein NW214_05290 [Pseudanabaenaceae cyanobacterium bins.39]|nr:hypothetical protein [Pseudanabaenaceae cyanobacterium bins.39]
MKPMIHFQVLPQLALSIGVVGVLLAAHTESAIANVSISIQLGSPTVTRTNHTYYHYGTYPQQQYYQQNQNIYYSQPQYRQPSVTYPQNYPQHSTVIIRRSYPNPNYSNYSNYNNFPIPYPVNVPAINGVLNQSIYSPYPQSDRYVIEKRIIRIR